MEMNRIDALIANPNYWYDDKAIDGFILYCENELTLTDGSDFHMLPSFKLWAEQIFGWYHFIQREVWDKQQHRFVTKIIKKRLIEKQYLIVARGAAKSMYGMAIQAYFLNVDTATTHQITTAPTMKQADEIMSPFRTAITRARGALFKFLTYGSAQNTTGSRALRQKLVSTKKGIENFLTGSLLEVRPMSIAKLQGLRPKVSTVDEWLSGDLREDVVGAIEQGASKLDEWLIVAISSEGTVRNGSGDTIKMELMSILRGEGTPADNISIFHYKLDDLTEVADPTMWVKAQPNIGLTVTYETYQQDVERAERAPASRNDILAKRFGIPMEGYTYFFTYEETEPHGKQDFWKMPCAMGADLSQGDDFCAFTFLFPLRLGFGVKTRSYITRLTLHKLPGAMRAKYEEFIQEGSLHVLEGTILDMMEVYEDLEAFIEREQYDIRAFGFDPYNAKEFVNRWEMENGAYGIEKVIQGARTESVPLGELKILSEERILFFDQRLMQFAMGNAITIEDTNGNRKLLKKRMEDKIDNVSALMDAYVAWKLHKEMFE
jgi:phage terminase large subunit-like protein